MIEFIMNNWFFVILITAIVFVVGYVIKVFFNMPSTTQISKLKEWLLYAVTEAEKEFGSGTGQIKLRYVYDMFIAQFPYLTNKIPFDTFSILVDEVLETFRDLLNKNEQIKNYVEHNSEVK